MIIIADYRNPNYSAEGTNQIDLEIFNAKYGWIPITILLDDDDNQIHIIDIKLWLINNIDSIAPYIAPAKLTDNELADIGRVSEYLPIQDQLDMIFHDLENGTKLWQDHIRAIKVKYPKV